MNLVEMLLTPYRRRREAWLTFKALQFRVTLEPIGNARFFHETRVYMTCWTGSMACVSDGLGNIDSRRVRAIYIGHLRSILLG